MKKYDVIVVGAGPAGASAAYVLAKSGLEVVLIERGEFPGEKNMFGGVFHGRVLHELIPDFQEQAPLERAVKRKVITFLGQEDAAVSIQLDSRRLGEPPDCGYTVRRNQFDRWFAGKAVEAGALLVNRTVVDDVIMQGGRVVGVRTRRDQGELYADVVVAADGVNSQLAGKAGLRKELQPQHVTLGVKEVLSLPRETIEARFNLKGNYGVANEFLGGFGNGVCGGGFLYTNKDSLAIGVVALIPSLRQAKVGIYELLEAFKNHPRVRESIEGGVVKEYSAHLIPEAGVEMMPQLHTDGMVVVGDAGAFVLATGLNLEGANYAVGSGMAAAEAVREAARAGDFSKKSLARYIDFLEANHLLKDLKKYKRASAFLANPRLHDLYPDLLCRLAEDLFLDTGDPKSKVMPLLRKQVRERTTTWRALKDGLEAGRALLW